MATESEKKAANQYERPTSTSTRAHAEQGEAERDDADVDTPKQWHLTRANLAEDSTVEPVR
jgi:hypothetical protein